MKQQHTPGPWQMGRLIASAPELLEALEKLELATDSLLGLIPRQCDKLPEVQNSLSAIAAARTAIAKAKGETL